MLLSNTKVGWKYRVYFCFAVFTLFAGQICVGQNAKIQGRLILTKAADLEVILYSTQIIVRINGIQRTSAIGDDLHFSVDSLHSGSAEITIRTPFMYPDTTIKKVEIQNGKVSFLEFSYPPYCKYDLSRNDKTCPVCKQKDKVLSILYGLPELSGVDVNKLLKEVRLGGCVMTGCDPNWYCQRDDIEF